MKILQNPADWQGVIPSINELYDFKESLEIELDTIKQLVVSLDERLKPLELKEVRRENLAKAREAKK